MKWILSALALAASLFMQNVKTVTTPNVLQQSRKILGLAYAGLIGSTLFSAGIIITVLNWPAYDASTGVLAIMPPFIGGMCLSILSVVGLIFIFLPRNWSPDPAPKKEHMSTLESSLAVLVMDFVKERQNDRERRRSNSSEAHL